MTGAFVRMAASALVGASAVVAVVSSQNLSRSDERLREATETMIFACGYLYGQNSITSQLPSIGLRPTSASGFPPDCPNARKQAVAHGFDTAAKDLP